MWLTISFTHGVVKTGPAAADKFSLSFLAGGTREAYRDFNARKDGFKFTVGKDGARNLYRDSIQDFPDKVGKELGRPAAVFDR